MSVRLIRVRVLRFNALDFRQLGLRIRRLGLTATEQSREGVIRTRLLHIGLAFDVDIASIGFSLALHMSLSNEIGAQSLHGRAIQVHRVL